MEGTLIPQNKEDWAYKNLVQQAESYNTSKRHIAVPITTLYTSRKTSTKRHNLDRNRLTNGQQQQNTAFNPSNKTSRNGLAKSHHSNYSHWDAITRNLNEKTKMQLI